MKLPENGLTRDNRLMAISLFLWGMGEGLFIYIQPLALKSFGAQPVAIGSILALAAVAAGLAHIPAGFLADRFGRKRVLIAGWSLGVLATLIMFLAKDLGLFVVGLVAYTFTGFVVAPINAYVAHARGAQSVQRAFTLVSAGFWGGTLLSPALGGYIARIVGLRAVFGASLALFLVSLWAMLQLAPQPRSAPPAGRSRYGALFRNRHFTGFLALIFAAVLAMQVGLPFMPNFVVEARGFDIGVVGLLGSANSLGTVACNLLLGQRLPRRGFMLGQALMFVSLVLLLAAGSPPWLLLAYFFRSGWYLAHNMAAAQVIRVVEPPETGLALGLTETMTALAAIIGPLVAGVLYQRDRAWPFLISLALIAATLPLVYRFAPRRDAHSAEAVSAGAGAGSGSSLS